MHCSAVPSWDDRWLLGQRNSAGSNSKNNTLTQIRAHLLSCRWVRAQTQSHCLYCPFWMLCVHARTKTQALEPRCLQLLHFFPCFPSLSPATPWICEILGFPSVMPREAEKILLRKHITCLVSKGVSGDRSVFFLPFPCPRVRIICKRGSFPRVYLLTIRFAWHGL